MKNNIKLKTLAVIALFFCNILKSQISIVNNITNNLAQNTDLTVEVKINKGAISNFSKFQIDFPAGVTVTEGDSKTGSFTFENNRAKIVWVSIPTEPEFIISMKLNTGSVSGSQQLFQKFYYLDNGVKKEVEVDPMTVNFTADGSKSLASIGAQSNNAVTSTTPANNSSNSTPTVASTQTNSNPTVSSTPTETLTTTTNNTGVATTTTVSFTTSSPSNTQNNTNTASNTSTSSSSSSSSTSNSSNQNTSVATTTSKNYNVTETKTSTPDGLNYRIQLGAFSISPEKSKFKTAGNIDVLNEGGMYKAMLGNFSSKDEAFKKLANLKTLGYDGIVISYQNGQRVGLVRQ